MTQASQIIRSDQIERPKAGLLRVSLQHRLGAFQLAVDFQVPTGLIALFGPSGAGKSLTLRCLAGLLHPEQGYLAINGQVLLDSTAGINLPPQQRRVGYVPQHYALFPHLNVAENIAFGLPKIARGVGWRTTRKAQQARVAELLDALELDGMERRLPSTLSGGQQQRVALARALAAEPRLLLLDEPFNALDATVRERLREALGQFQRRFEVPIVLVTHDRAEAQQLADTMIVILQGRVAQSGSSEAIFRTPCTAEVARLIGQRNFFKGQVALPATHPQPAPPRAIHLERLSASTSPEQPSPAQDAAADGAWLPFPTTAARSPYLQAPQTCIAGCIHPDEVVVHRWAGSDLPSIWTPQGTAQWLATVIDAQTFEHDTRLIVRPQWAASGTTDIPDATATLEIYLSRRQWREIEATPGELLLLEIAPEAVHCFDTR